MITIIIPVLNEEKTIASVISYCQAKPLVSEIIVVDDKSFDNTVKYAAEAGAKVITYKNWQGCIYERWDALCEK
jgi:glucosyl-3-phosphoglycerate synthase